MHFEGCSVVPAKSEHAVQAAVFVCELPAAVSSEAIGRVIAYYDSSAGLKEIFPRKTEVRGMAIAVSPKSVGVRTDGEIAGVKFDRLMPDGNVELAISLQGNLLSFTCNIYSRWATVSEQALGLLKEFAAFLLPEPGVGVFGLQYVDEFFVTGDHMAFRPSMLFARDNEQIPRFLQEQAGSWHNHTGWFEDDVDGGFKTLNNVNINVALQPEKLVVQIIAAHRHIMPKPIDTAEGLALAIRPQFDLLHSGNKDLLRKLLRDEIRSAIHLEGAE